MIGIGNPLLEGDPRASHPGRRNGPSWQPRSKHAQGWRPRYRFRRCTQDAGSAALVMRGGYADLQQPALAGALPTRRMSCARQQSP